MALIDYPEQWEATQLIGVAQSQVWDEILAVECPLLDSRRDLIPDAACAVVFTSPAYRLLSRIEARIRQSWTERN